MFKALKQYFQNKTNINRKAKEVGRNENYECHIRLAKGEEFSKFSTNENKIVNPELVDYIDHEISTITRKNNLSIVVHSPKENLVDVVELENALDNHYKVEIVKTQLEANKLLKYGLLMFLLGTLIFTVYVYLKTQVANSLWFELVDIASWVFVWEAVDCFFLSQISRKQQQEHYLKVVNAEIKLVKE